MDGIFGRRRVIAKGSDYILRTLSDSEYRAYAALIAKGDFGQARKYFGTAIHETVALELEDMRPGRYEYIASGDVDFMDTAYKIRIELTTFRDFDNHLNRSNSNYRLAGYVLYKIGRLPTRTMADEIAGRGGVGHEE